MSELDSLCRHIEEIGEQLDLPPRLQMSLNLTIEELFTNIVSYGYKDDEEHLIDISIQSEGDCITVRMEDDGIAFNPLQTDSPDIRCPLEDREIGGLGIHICRKMMDEIDYRRLDDKNVMTMKIFLLEK
jgi:serine/threonine-protein kinase RsbW